MAISKNTQANIDDSDLANYPNGQVKDDDGTGNGFPLERTTTSDIFEFFDKLMRLAAIAFNNSFDNVANGYQLVNAAIALASKSDYILPITTISGVLQIPTNLDILQLNEKLICQAASNYTTETQIKGTTATLLTVTITRQYKANDYLTLVRTSGGIKLVSDTTADNLAVQGAEAGFLPAANNTDTLTGAAVNKAVTPASLLYTFQQRLNNAANAAPFVASATQPGILSIALYNQIANFVNPVKNVGWFSGYSSGSGTVGSFYSVSGNIVSAQLTAVDGGIDSVVLVTFANAMSGVNFFVRMHLESDGNILQDNNCQAPVFVPLTTTTFRFSTGSVTSSTQSIKVHIEVVQI